jgi:hypothetical protein
MKPNERFCGLPGEFWVNVKLISQQLQYTERGTGQVKKYTREEIENLYSAHDLDSLPLFEGGKNSIGNEIIAYCSYRADALNTIVENNLMNKAEAREKFDTLKKKLKPTWAIPMNKQKGNKKGEAYFTAIINMLIEKHMVGKECDYNPKSLITFNKNNAPYRIMSRHVDGAYPCIKDPIAVWEIKEYYNTTTFGSRVADGIYEVLLDGLEIKDANKALSRNVKNYLMVDAYGTWWLQGKSYLCRIIDLMHMGMITEALFGREVIERLPIIVKEWE